MKSLSTHEVILEDIRGRSCLYPLDLHLVVYLIGMSGCRNFPSDRKLIDILVLVVT